MEKENGIWKMMTMAFAGIVVSGIGSWLVFDRDKITHNEALELIELHAPYTRDRQSIMDKLNAIERLIDAIDHRQRLALQDIKLGEERDRQSALDRIDIRMQINDLKETLKQSIIDRIKLHDELNDLKEKLKVK